MTTVLTIYRFGLRGNSGDKSIRKHRFRTKKHRKVVKITQKIGIVLFGSTMSQVQILSFRPKRGICRTAIRCLFLFAQIPVFDVCLPQTESCFTYGECCIPTQTRQEALCVTSCFVFGWNDVFTLAYLSQKKEDKSVYFLKNGKY